MKTTDIEKIKTLDDYTIKEAIRKSIDNYFPLTKEQERGLFLAYKKGNKVAKDLLIKHNLKLVFKLVSEFYKVNDDNFGDVFNYATERMIISLKSFKVEKGYKYSSYLIWVVQRAIYRYFYKYDDIIKIPEHALRKKNKYSKKINDLLMQGYTLEEISKEVNISDEDLQFYMQLDKKVCSLDTKVGDEEDTTLEEMIPDDKMESPEISAVRSEIRREILLVLRKVKLNKKQRFIIMNQLKDDEHILSKAGIARVFNCKKQAIDYVTNKAFKLVRCSDETDKLAGIIGEKEEDIKRLTLMREYYKTNPVKQGALIGVENGQVVTMK